MTARSTKSNSGRIEWIVQDGRLKEISPESFTFTLTATDTLILAGLLIVELDNIKAAAEREQSLVSGEKHPLDVMHERYIEKKKYEDSLAEGYEITQEDMEFTDAT